jgi:hypothetical protein
MVLTWSDFKAVDFAAVFCGAALRLGFFTLSVMFDSSGSKTSDETRFVAFKICYPPV